MTEGNVSRVNVVQEKWCQFLQSVYLVNHIQDSLMMVYHVSYRYVVSTKDFWRMGLVHSARLILFTLNTLIVVIYPFVDLNSI